MRNLTSVALVIAALVVTGCGEHDNENGSGGGGPVETTPPAMSTPTADEGCSETHPYRQASPSGYDGFMIICGEDATPDAWKLSIENRSDTAVISARPVQQAWSAAAVTPVPAPHFAQAQIQLQVPASCDAQACTLPPGSTLEISADEPVRAVLETRAAETMAAAVAYTGLTRLNSKLGTPGQRLLDQAAACYSTVANVGVTSRPYEEQFRNLLGLQGCRSLYQDIARETAEPPPLERSAAYRGVYTRAQKLLGASFNDAMVFVFKIAHR